MAVNHSGGSMQITVTPIYTAIIALLVLLLAYRVVQLRRSEKVALGDGGNEKLRRAMASHSHALENAPMSLLLMLLLELNSFNAGLLHLLGIALVLSRLLHLYGQSRITARSFGRYWGTVINWLLIVTMAVLNVSVVTGVA
jgi:uncharacterized membrane protein YecN with MAPEG domain